MKSRSCNLLLAALASLSLFATPAHAKNPGSQGRQDPPGQLVNVQLLAFNDYHGHVKTDAVGFGEPRGGGEYLAAKLAALRAGNKYSLTVAAGDLIGGTPAFSGLFRDEPSVESLNLMALDISAVGNHEFDEGVTELLRMQNGGCHPTDGCFFPGSPFAGADFQWLAANVVSEVDGETTPLPPYRIEKIESVKVAFIGMTLEGTDALVAASGIAGWDFLDEAETANNLVPLLHEQGVNAIVVLLHEGGAQDPAPGDVNACNDFSGPIKAINDALDPEIDVLVTGHTHLPYNCRLPDAAGFDRIVTSAYSFGRVVSEIQLVLDKRSNDVRRDLSFATNHEVVRDELLPAAHRLLYDYPGDNGGDRQVAAPVRRVCEQSRGDDYHGYPARRHASRVRSRRRISGGQPGSGRAAVEDAAAGPRRADRLHESRWRTHGPEFHRGPGGSGGRRRRDLWRGIFVPALQ